LTPGRDATAASVRHEPQQQTPLGVEALHQAQAKAHEIRTHVT